MFGTVKWFNEQRGYGFIIKLPLGGEVFVHIKQVRGKRIGVVPLLPGDEVDFDVIETELGERAQNVVVLKRHKTDPAIRDHSPDYVHD